MSRIRRYDVVCKRPDSKYVIHYYFVIRNYIVSEAKIDKQDYRKCLLNELCKLKSEHMSMYFINFSTCYPYFVGVFFK